MLCLYAQGFLPAQGLAAAQGQASAVPAMAVASAPDEISVFAICLNFMYLFHFRLIGQAIFCMTRLAEGSRSRMEERILHFPDQ